MTWVWGVAFAALAQQPPNIPTLEGRWRLDATSGTLAADSSGKGRDGTLMAGAVISTQVPAVPPGNLRSVEIANATSNQRVAVAHNPGLAPAGPFTLACWVRPTGTPNTQMGLVEKWTGGTSAVNGYLLRLGKVNDPATGHHLKVNVGNGTTQIEVGQYGQALPLNTWTHAAATFNGTTLTLYRNGVSVGTPAGAAVTTSSDPLHLGQDYGNNRLQGQIDEVHVFSEALTPAQIGILINGQPAPTNLQVQALVDSLNVSWNAAPNALVYHLYRADGAGAFVWIADVTTTSYHDANATYPGTYSYRVSAESYMESGFAGPSGGSPLSPIPRTNDHEEGLLDGNCACGSSIPAGSTPWAAGLLLLCAAAVFRRR